MKKIIAVIGDSKIDYNDIKFDLAYQTGKILIDNGYRIQTGGLGGIMSAVCEGAKTSLRYKDGDTIALIPSFDRQNANPFADIVIPTGLDVMRNAMVVNADAVIAIGGGSGTLSEIAIAWSLFKLIIAYNCVEGWSKELAGRKIDNRERYKNLDDKIFPAESPFEMLGLLSKYIEKYNRCHKGIK